MLFRSPTATESTKGFRIQSSSTGDFSIEKGIDYNSFNFYSDGGSGGFGTSLLKSNPEEGFSAQFTGLGNENYNVTANTTGITLNSSIGGVGNELTVTPTLVAINGNEVVTINQLSTGKITVTDISEQAFTDLNSANAWLTLYTNATITNESYSNHVYKFTVPANSDFSLNGDFCGISSSEVQFEDPSGLVTIFGNSAFKSNTQNNILGNVTFGTGCFRNAMPSIKNTINQIVNCNIEFALDYSGRIDVNLFGADGTANLPTDIFVSSALVWINTSYNNKFKNVGTQDLDITNIETNFSNGNSNSVVNYEGIKKIVDLSSYELITNKQTDLTSSATNYPTVDAVNTGLATKQNTLVSGTDVKTINGNTIVGSGNLDVGNAFTSNNITQFTNNTSDDIANKVLDETGTGSLVFNTNPVFGGTVTVGAIQVNGASTNDYIKGNGGVANFTNTVRAVTISSGTLSNTAIVGGETIANAFGKAQGQINTVNTTLTTKQNTLVSGTDIKTINSTTVLGSGNLALFYKGNFSTTATAQTTFTVSIGATMTNTTYRVPQPGAQNALSAVWYFVTNKTTTTFDIVTMSALSGVVSYDWVVYP